MNFLVRANGSNQAGKANVLDNEGVGFERNDFFQKFGQFLQFSLKNEHIHGQKGSHAANAGVADHIANIVEGKVFGTAAGVPVGDSEIYGVGPVVHGGFKHFARAHGQQEFRRCRSAIHEHKDRYFFYILHMKSKVTLSAIILSAFAFFAVFSLSACTDEAAEAEMNRLAAENAVLQGQVDSLQKNLDSLTAYGDSVKKSLEKLDMHP